MAAASDAQQLSTIERSDKAKAAGVDAYKRGDHKAAIKKYTIALKHAQEAEEGALRPERLQSNRTSTILSNRCMAHLALDDVDAALADATAAVKAAPDWPKAHFRLGTVHMRKRAWTKAYAAFKQGWHYDMTNEELTKACQDAHQAMMGFDRQDKVMSQEELFKLREGKLEEQYKKKIEKQKQAAAPLMAAATGAPVADLSYREEALMRTVQMANPNSVADIQQAERDLEMSKLVKEVEAATTATDVAAGTSAEAPGSLDVSDGVTAPSHPAPAAEATAPAHATSSESGASLLVDRTPPDVPAAIGPPEYCLCQENGAIVLTVRAPRLETMKDLDLSVSSDLVELCATDETLYAPLRIALPMTVDENAAKAKWDKRNRVLTIRFPTVTLAAQEGVVV